MADRDVFVESIPFSETRGYVKKVLRNYAEYKRIYGKAGLATLPSATRDAVSGPVVVQRDARTPESAHAQSGTGAWNAE